MIMRRGTTITSQHLLDRVPALVSYWGTDCRNVLANAAYQGLFGVADQDIEGMHLAELLGWEAYRRTLPYIRGVLAGKDQCFEETRPGPDGHLHHFEVTYLPDIVEGTTVGFYVLGVDVTARVAAQRDARRSLELHRAIARSMPGSFVLLFDAELRYLVADGPGLAAFGLRGPDLEGRLMPEVLPERAGALEPLYRAALRGEQHKWDRVVNGRVIEMAVGPVRDDDGAAFAGLVVGTDVTAARRRRETDRALHMIARSTAHGASTAKVAAEVARALLSLLGAAHASVSRFADDGLEILAVEPPLEGLPGRLPTGTGPYGTAAEQVAEDGEAHYVHYGPSGQSLSGLLHEAGIAAGAAAPIWVNGRLWGAAGVGLSEAAGDPEEVLERLREFAAAVATSISSSAAWDALRALAGTDPLTCLPNRRTFEERLDQAVNAAQRQGHGVGLVMVDLDKFKALNDTHGHPEGDKVLAALANRMASAVRSDELLARLGGDEFALLLPRAGAEQARAAARRLRSAVSQSPIEGQRVTITTGVASLRGVSASRADLLALADADLYRAKPGSDARVLG